MPASSQPDYRLLGTEAAASFLKRKKPDYALSEADVWALVRSKWLAPRWKPGLDRDEAGFAIFFEGILSSRASGQAKRGALAFQKLLSSNARAIYGKICMGQKPSSHDALMLERLSRNPIIKRIFPGCEEFLPPFFSGLGVSPVRVSS